MWCVTDSSLGLSSSDVTHVSFVKPLGTVTLTHSITFFGGCAGTLKSGRRTIRSGWICQPSVGHTFGLGAAAASPSGAPVSTHLAMVSICAWVSERSFAKGPVWGSANHGGIVFATTRFLMLRAHGRVLS